MPVAILSKKQKTCQRPDVHLICWLDLTAPSQDIERVGEHGVWWHLYERYCEAGYLSD